MNNGGDITMGRYCNAQDVRTFTGLSITDASDLDLEEFLDPGTKAIIEQITVTRDWEEMSGSSTSVNWYTRFYPIADADGDLDIDKNDVTVYAWGDVDDADTRVQLTVSSVVASEGRVVLASAPGSDYEVITCNYRYYPNEVDWDLIKLAAALYTGYLYAFTKWIFIPDTYSIGPIRLRNVEPVWEKIYKQYVRTLALIQKRPYSIREPQTRKSLEDMDTIWG